MTFRGFLSCVIVVVFTSFCDAQNIVIQQPVMRQFGVRTTASVPDRGSVLLGSVSSAASGRTTYGPLPSGTAAGFNASASSMDMSVFIHDLEAMDRAVLEQGEKLLIRRFGSEWNSTAKDLRTRSKSRPTLHSSQIIGEQGSRRETALKILKRYRLR